MPPFTFDEAQIAAWVAPIFWPFLRILAVFTSAPVLSSRSVPIRVRIGLSFLVAVAIAPMLPSAPVHGLNDPNAVALATQQVVVGLAIGFVVRVLFGVMELAGEIIGFQMGLNFAAFFDPAMNSQSSAVARMFTQLTALLFVVLNGHVLVLGAVANSFTYIPIGVDFLPRVQGLEIYKLGAELFASAFWIALPIVGVLMFTNMALGVISRVAPQMNIFAIGFPITLVVGMLAIAVVLPDMLDPFNMLMGKLVAMFGS